MSEHTDNREDTFWRDLLSIQNGENPDFDDFLNEQDAAELDSEVSSSTFRSWRRVSTKSLDVSISTTATDELLLGVAKQEMTIVCERVLSALGELPPTSSNILNLFIQPLLPILLEAMNSRRAASNEESATTMTNSHVIEFIRCIASMSLYRVTPTNFFDPAMAKFYPIAAERNKDVFSMCMSRLKKGMLNLCIRELKLYDI